MGNERGELRLVPEATEVAELQQNFHDSIDTCLGYDDGFSMVTSPHGMRAVASLVNGLLLRDESDVSPFDALDHTFDRLDELYGLIEDMGMDGRVTGPWGDDRQIATLYQLLLNEMISDENQAKTLRVLGAIGRIHLHPLGADSCSPDIDEVVAKNVAFIGASHLHSLKETGEHDEIALEENLAVGMALLASEASRQIVVQGLGPDAQSYFKDLEHLRTSLSVFEGMDSAALVSLGGDLRASSALLLMHARAIE